MESEENNTQIITLMKNFIGVDEMSMRNIIKYISGGNPKEEIKLILLLRELCNNNNIIDASHKYRILSMIKLTGSTYVNRNFANGDIASSFSFVGEKSNRKHICNICGMQCGRNKVKEHWKICENREIICIYCGSDPMHPFEGEILKSRRFCPIESINCEFCGVLIMKAPYFMYHKQSCGDTNDVQCSRCYNFNKRKDSFTHFVQCIGNETNGGIANCVTLREWENIDRNNKKSTIEHFINKWIHTIANSYLKIYQDRIMGHFYMILSLGGYHNSELLYHLSLLRDAPEQFPYKPLDNLRMRINMEKSNIYEIYDKLNNCGLLNNETVIASNHVNPEYKNYVLFTIFVHTMVIPFSIECTLHEMPNENGYMTFKHVRIDYKDNELNTIIDREQSFMPNLVVLKK
jgi:hypothetical protein